jgi:hypothetical protein
MCSSGLRQTRQAPYGRLISTSDAALAYDRGAEILKVRGRTFGKARNFESKVEYKNARERELRASRITIATAGSVDDVERQISQRISEIRDPSIIQKTSAYTGIVLMKTVPVSRAN